MASIFIAFIGCKIMKFLSVNSSSAGEITCNSKHNFVATSNEKKGVLTQLNIFGFAVIKNFYQ